MEMSRDALTMTEEEFVEVWGEHNRRFWQIMQENCPQDEYITPGQDPQE